MAYRILITGINGFIGRYIVKELLKYNDIQIMGFTHTHIDESFGKDVAVKCVDLLNKDDLTNIISEFKPTSVVHLAAVASPTYNNREEIYNTNVLGSENLLDVLYNICDVDTRIILTSTAGVYGSSKFANEDTTPYNPVNHYSLSKMVMEYISKKYMDKLDIKIIRPFNVVGAGQKESFLIPKLVKAYATRQLELRVGNMNTYRDFIDVNFVAKFYCKLILLKNIGYNIVNVCSGVGITGNEVLKMLNDITQYSPKVVVDSKFVRKNDIMYLIGDPTKCNEIVDGKFKARSFQEILIDMVKWYSEAKTI